MRWMWIGIVGMGLLAGCGKEEAPLPTKTVALTATASLTPSATPSSTVTATATSSPTTTLTPSATATLSEQVREVQAVMPGVVVAMSPSGTPLPEGLQILEVPPDPLEPLLNATQIPAPYTDFSGWVSFESDHPAITYVTGNWTPLGSQQASQGQYHYTEDSAAQMRLVFEGEAVRVRYVGFTNGGVWEVYLDGVMREAIDGYADAGVFAGTRVYDVGAGRHTLELHNTATANPASSGHMLALDAVQVYRPDALTWIVPGGVLPTAPPSATPAAVQVGLVQAPPTVVPTGTVVPPQVVVGAIIIAYDENANEEVDVNEGVRGVPVRLVELGTHRVIAYGYTDDQGYAQVQAVTSTGAQVVVPYFATTYEIPRGGAATPFLLLLPPGNQPGLIP